jgi:hypothetical protein
MHQQITNNGRHESNLVYHHAYGGRNCGLVVGTVECGISSLDRIDRHITKPGHGYSGLVTVISN